MSLLRRLADIARSRLGAPAPLPGRTGRMDGPGQGGEGRGAEPEQAAPVDPRLAGYFANLELPYGASLSQLQAALSDGG